MEAGERAENLERQAEEAEALAAIYGDDFVREGDGGTVWEIRVPLGDPDDPDERRRQSDDAMLTRDGTPAPDCLVARVTRHSAVGSCSTFRLEWETDLNPAHVADSQ